MPIGALFQLQHKSKQDIYFTERPEHNFIKQCYKRYNNFSIQNVSINSEQEVNFGKTFEFKITKEGDFLHKIYLVLELPKLTKTSGGYTGWTNSIGNAIIDFVELEIAGQIIDKKYGLYYEIINEIEERRTEADKLIGKFLHIQKLKTNAENNTKYIIPLKFWFSDNIGSSLPLLGLKYCPVIIRIKLRPFEECIVYDGITPPNTEDIISGNLLAEYIYMEDDLREKFIGQSNKYLIQEVQYKKENLDVAIKKFKIDLPFLGFVTELLFVLREKQSEFNNDWFNFSKRITVIGDPVLPLLNKAKLVVDGIDRIEIQDQLILNLLNNYRFHTNPTDKHIYNIPFCDNPEKLIPNGGLNFSTIDFTYLYLELANFNVDIDVFIFAKTFNLLTIEDGVFRLGFN